MRKSSAISWLLAAATSTLLTGLVTLVAPAGAATEEDLAAVKGSFVSTMPLPTDKASNFVWNDEGRGQWIVSASEEDAAAPAGSFTTAMQIPASQTDAVRFAANAK